MDNDAQASIAQSLERIADTLEIIAGNTQPIPPRCENVDPVTGQQCGHSAIGAGLCKSCFDEASELMPKICQRYDHSTGADCIRPATNGKLCGVHLLMAQEVAAHARANNKCPKVDTWTGLGCGGAPGASGFCLYHTSKKHTNEASDANA